MKDFFFEKKHSYAYVIFSQVIAMAATVAGILFLIKHNGLCR